MNNQINTEIMQSKATLEETRMEVGTGEPGYKWVVGYYLIRPDKVKLYPAMSRAEAIAVCKREGWAY